jgi:hypothetical protein
MSQTPGNPERRLGDAEQVAESGEEELAIGSFGSAGGSPEGDERFGPSEDKDDRITREVGWGQV